MDFVFVFLMFQLRFEYEKIADTFVRATPLSCRFSFSAVGIFFLFDFGDLGFDSWAIEYFENPDVYGDSIVSYLSCFAMRPLGTP